MRVKEGALPTKITGSTANNDKDVESESQKLCENIATDHQQTDEAQVKTEASPTVSNRTDEEKHKMPCENTCKVTTGDYNEENVTASDTISEEDVSESNILENEITGIFLSYTVCFILNCEFY